MRRNDRNMKLQGKVAIVTGAADGIGRGTAVKFAREGADLLLVDLNESGLSATSTLVAEAGGRVEEMVADVTGDDSPERIVARAVERLGALDILVNNAGVPPSGHFLTITEESMDRVMAVNLRAPFLLGQAAARHWIEQKKPGRIVNISSINAETIQGDSSDYCASKGGVRMLTKAAACDLGRYGITVNAVGPGHTRTGMTRHLIDNPELEQDWVGRTPLGRLGEPEDIANAVAFLVSDEAAYITGQTIYVEGGRTLHIP